MSPLRWKAVLGLAVVLATAGDLRAQRSLQDPHIGFAYPAGGQTGASFEVLVGGQYLEGTSEAYVSGGGVQVAIVKYYKHLSREEAMRIRNRLRNTRRQLEDAQPKGQKSHKITEEEVRKAAGVQADYQEKMADYRRREAQPKRQPNPQLLEEVTLQVKIAANAKPGDRELRLIAPNGMSNPLVFQVGPLTEYRESEPNDKQPDPKVGVTLPAVVNGQIMPGDVDRFSFRARKGTRLVVLASARALIPYVADAVPGWFQAVLALHDSTNKELAYANAFGFHQDPALYYEIPQDGEYTVVIRDAIYRGREDFVYRLSIGELPLLTSVFPLGGRAGTKLEVDLKGWNLPSDKLKLEPAYDRAHAIRSISVSPTERLPSNSLPFAVDMVNETLEQEPNNEPSTAQAVEMPLVVNGRIEKPGDRDVFRFEGRAKQTLVAEVYARRLNSPLDSLLRLTDSAGREVASNDDYEDQSLALATHHADSRIAVALPADGMYYLHLTDSQRKGGADFAYRLHIRPSRPDFELRVVPSSVIGHVGACVPITVYALRKDGFADDILLDLEKAPPGFRLNGAWVPGNLTKIRLTLTVPPNPTAEPLALHLEGHSLSHGSRLSHLAIPAEAMMQAFAYQHLVPAKDWSVAVTGKAGTRPVVQFIKEERIKLAPHGVTPLRLATTLKNPAELRLELSEPPDGITIRDVKIDGASVLVAVRTDAKAKPGLKGNLIFNAFQERTASSSAGAKAAKSKRTLLGMLPALPFEIPGR